MKILFAALALLPTFAWSASMHNSIGSVAEENSYRLAALTVQDSFSCSIRERDSDSQNCFQFSPGTRGTVCYPAAYACRISKSNRGACTVICPDAPLSGEL